MKEGVDRFDLENAMSNMAGILDDIELFREEYELDDFQDNFMLGLETIYRVRWNNMYKIFEEMVHTGKM